MSGAYPIWEVVLTGTLRIIDRTGHTEVPWDTENAVGPLDPAYANAEFDRLVRVGAMAYDMDADERIRKFDPERHTNILVVPQFVGG